MPAIEYQETDLSGIELIRTLWTRLNTHHHANARVFQDVYAGMTFDDRKAYFSKIAMQGSLRIVLAFDPEQGIYAGYCVSSLSKDNEGEIESISVDETYRMQGIGTNLLTRALTWLNNNGSIRNRVSVADGNEAAFPFYRKFGFYPRMTVLEQSRD
ncbi:N-acetyltransferase [Methanoregula sp.]|uniref:GNAT family N-acetyltransferase n=1 Tax=Methanoregula sp. TaxID=2052170 RepID=UPI000CBAA69D|nr:GNAT family N-acetyltransferase [Methanoregula sp.]PKG33277.1 MAG: N-acetyltransferase [Methanoregula sp.]